MVNPASEKPKIGRGVLMKESEWSQGPVMVDKCLSPRNRNRTWLINIIIYFEKRIYERNRRKT